MTTSPSRQPEESFVYGFKITFQFDDGKHFQATYNETQFIIDRSSSTPAGKKLSALLLLLTSIMLKTLPCLLIICACRCRGGEEVVQQAISRLRGGRLTAARVGTRWGAA